MQKLDGMPQGKHLLLKLAKTYPVYTGDLMPREGIYDLLQGVWLSRETGVPLVESGDIPYSMTKKADVETGEDQKGE